MYYAVIDTNVLVSAMLKANSNPGQVVLEAVIGRITPVLNQEILNEYNEVLRRKKFSFKEERIISIIDGIIDRAIFLDAESLEEKLPDPKDVIFYEVTMEARKESDAYLVTGNLKHFPERSFIVTPAEMMDIIQK